TIAAKCYVRIKENPVIAIIDSRAAVSIITNKLMNKLRLEPDAPSKTVVITANRTRARALGQITDLRICIQDLIVPIKLQVIESREETLLLGTDWLQKMKANWDFDTQTLQIQHHGKITKIGTTHFSDETPQYITDSEDSDDELDDIEYDEESLDEQETYYSDNPKRNEKLKETNESTPKFEENPAIYLSDHMVNHDRPTEISILSPKQQESVDQLIEENRDIFAEQISKEGLIQDLGRTSI